MHTHSAWPARPLQMAIDDAPPDDASLVRAAASVLGGATAIGLSGRDDIPHRGLYEGNPALAALMTSHGHPYALSRQVCGFILSLERAYAGANSMIVAFSFTGPADRTFVGLQSWDERLTTAQGVRLRDGAESSTSTMEHNSAHVAFAFDTHAVAQRGGKLDLRLTVPGFILRQKKTIADWNSQPCERITSFAIADNSGLSLLDRLRRTAGRLLPRLFAGDQIGATMDISIDRPLTIPFSVPVDTKHTRIKRPAPAARP